MIDHSGARERHDQPRLVFAATSFSYGRRHPVVSNIDLQLGSRRTVLLGPNGAGKTTLLKLGCGILRPTAGEVTLGSASTVTRAGRRRVAETVGFMPQDVRPLPGLTVRQQVAYAGWLRGLSRSEAEARSVTALHTVGLSDRADVPSTILSGGQLRRVGVAQLIVADARLVLLDEPSAGLDPAERARLREIIAGLDCSVVVSTHLVDDLEDAFDAVIVLVAGHIIFQGPTASFLDYADSAAPTAESAYLRLLDAASSAE